MGSYLLRRLLLVIPTLFGIMLLNFAIIQIVPGGPVEQMIAQMTGTAVESTARFSGSGEENLNLSLRGYKHHLDDFVSHEDSNKKLIALPKGIVVHWLAGNVPTLGIEKFFGSFNKNIITKIILLAFITYIFVKIIGLFNVRYNVSDK